MHTARNSKHVPAAQRRDLQPVEAQRVGVGLSCVRPCAYACFVGGVGCPLHLAKLQAKHINRGILRIQLVVLRQQQAQAQAHPVSMWCDVTCNFTYGHVVSRTAHT